MVIWYRRISRKAVRTQHREGWRHIQNKPNTKRPPARKRRAVFASKKDCRAKLAAYFDEFLPKSGEIADIEGLADYLGTTRDVLWDLSEHRIYGTLLQYAFNRIAKIKKQLAFCGKLPATVLSFDLKNNHGYRDRPEEHERDTGTTVIFAGKTEDWSK